VKDCFGGVGASIGLKNFMGLISNRGEFHSSGNSNLNYYMTDLMLVRKPDFTIIDGIRVLMTAGLAAPVRSKQRTRCTSGATRLPSMLWRQSSSWRKPSPMFPPWEPLTAG